MKLTEGPIPVPVEPTFDSETPCWKPHIGVDDTTHAFLHRLLRDFHYRWRHILRNNYDFKTLRALSRAIIPISTLDFEVHENTGGHRRLGVHVWITESPAWKLFESDLVRVGTVWVVLCQDIQDGLSKAQQHVASLGIDTTESAGVTTSSEARVNYMILSVKHVMLCHATERASLKYTAPEPLFNGDYGTGPPSDLALNYLIWATASPRPSISTATQSLPIEIQDMILGYSSIGTAVAAKLGCMLGLESPFSWRDGPLKVILEERFTVRPRGCLVETEVLFDEQKSGVVYIARAGQSRQIDEILYGCRKSMENTIIFKVRLLRLGRSRQNGWFLNARQEVNDKFNLKNHYVGSLVLGH